MNSHFVLVGGKDRSGPGVKLWPNNKLMFALGAEMVKKQEVQKGLE